MLNFFASLKCSKNASIMYRSLVVLWRALTSTLVFSTSFVTVSLFVFMFCFFFYADEFQKVSSGFMTWISWLLWRDTALSRTNDFRTCPGSCFFRCNAFCTCWLSYFFSRPTACMNVSNEFGIDSSPLILTGLQPRGGRVRHIVLQIGLAHLLSVLFLDDNGTG